MPGLGELGKEIFGAGASVVVIIAIVVSRLDCVGVLAAAAAAAAAAPVEAS